MTLADRGGQGLVEMGLGVEHSTGCRTQREEHGAQVVRVEVTTEAPDGLLKEMEEYLDNILGANL